MLILKTTSTDIVVTLSERISTFSTVVFLFEQQQSELEISIAAGATHDITIPMYGTSGTTGASGPAINNDRYMKYNLKNSQCANFVSGYWDYFVYGTTATLGFTSSGLIDTTGMTELERGKAYVRPTLDTTVTYGPTVSSPVIYNA